MSEAQEAKICELLEKGLQHYGMGEPSRALAIWSEVLSLDPTNIRAAEYIKFVSDGLQDSVAAATPAGVELSPAVPAPVGPPAGERTPGAPPAVDPVGTDTGALAASGAAIPAPPVVEDMGVPLPVDAAPAVVVDLAPPAPAVAVDLGGQAEAAPPLAPATAPPLDVAPPSGLAADDPLAISWGDLIAPPPAEEPPASTAAAPEPAPEPVDGSVGSAAAAPEVTLGLPPELVATLVPVPDVDTPSTPLAADTAVLELDVEVEDALAADAPSPAPPPADTAAPLRADDVPAPVPSDAGFDHDAPRVDARSTLAPAESPAEVARAADATPVVDTGAPPAAAVDEPIGAPVAPPPVEPALLLVAEVEAAPPVETAAEPAEAVLPVDPGPGTPAEVPGVVPAAAALEPSPVLGFAAATGTEPTAELAAMAEPPVGTAPAADAVASPAAKATPAWLGALGEPATAAETLAFDWGQAFDDLSERQIRPVAELLTSPPEDPVVVEVPMPPPRAPVARAEAVVAVPGRREVVAPAVPVVPLPGRGEAALRVVPAAPIVEAPTSPWDEGPALSAPVTVQPVGADFLVPTSGEHNIEVVSQPSGPGGVAAVAPAVVDAEQELDACDRLMQGARDMFDLGDFSGSLELVEKVLELEPDNAQARDYLERNQDTLLKMYESKIGSFSRVPRVSIPPDEVIWLNLHHRAGFLLAQIDGLISFEDLLALSAMSKLETCKILVQLLNEGVIVAS